MTTTRENMRLYESGEIPSGTFQAEFIAWMRAYGDKKYKGRYGVAWNELNIAQDLKVHRNYVSRWVDGYIPDIQNCRKIAALFGILEDVVLYTAGHPTFSAIIQSIRLHRFEWQDGEFIYAALKMTQEQRWRLSHSHWKAKAETKLNKRWSASMSVEQLHQLLVDVADDIYSWCIDPQREVPLYQRQVAMSA